MNITITDAIQLISETLNIESSTLTEDTNLGDIAGTPDQANLLRRAVMTKYNISISQSTADRLGTIGRAVDYINQRLA